VRPKAAVADPAPDVVIDEVQQVPRQRRAVACRGTSALRSIGDFVKTRRGIPRSRAKAGTSSARCGTSATATLQPSRRSTVRPSVTRGECSSSGSNSNARTPLMKIAIPNASNAGTAQLSRAIDDVLAVDHEFAGQPRAARRLSPDVWHSGDVDHPLRGRRHAAGLHAHARSERRQQQRIGCSDVLVECAQPRGRVWVPVGEHALD